RAPGGPVPLDGEEFPARGHVPDSHDPHFIRPRGYRGHGEPLPVRAPGHAADRAFAGLAERQVFLWLGDVPDLDGEIQTRRGQSLPVGTPGDRGYEICMSAQGKSLLPRGWIADLYHSLST